jgi:hypothetical protein
MHVKDYLAFLAGDSADDFQIGFGNLQSRGGGLR